MTSLHPPHLGRVVAIPEGVDPTVLYGIDRAAGRARQASGAAPFRGADLWNCYEFAWVDESNRPRVGVCRITVPADSPRIVESKSLKLYLGGFYATNFESTEAAAATVRRDLDGTIGAPVNVTIFEREALAQVTPRHESATPVDLDDYPIKPIELDALTASCGGKVVEERLKTSVFRSICPVTGQPDWAEVLIHYRGPRLEPGAVAGYLASFRAHGAFHEDVCEQIFVDLSRIAPWEHLLVQCHFLRRGGIDINPWRCSPNYPEPVEYRRAIRQ